MKSHYLAKIVPTVLACVLPVAVRAASQPKMGDKAPDFSLKTLGDQTVRLSDLTAKTKVVLIVLRGWPGYQCPVCTAQVQDYISSAADLASANVRVVMVYPGPAPDLQAHAKEFLEDKQWPKQFLFAIDPDYTTTDAYGLWWNSPGETSYPSTFVIDRMGIVRFAKISHSHGNRTKAQDVLTELKSLPAD
jgi:peroxiredoxin Q/BCP